MSAREAMKTSKTSTGNSNMLISGIAIFVFDILFIYFFNPENPIFCLTLAFILWHITVEDYREQMIDIRMIGLFFCVGLFCRGLYPFYLFSGLTSFFLLHIAHELCAKVEKIDGWGDYHYATLSPGMSEDAAPPYIPFFSGSLAFVLTYYLLALPMPKGMEYALFAVPAFEDMAISWTLWLLPLVLFFISVGLHYRSRRLMETGHNIVYRGFGDGDIYFFGAAIGIFGFFVTLLSLCLSLIPVYYVCQKKIAERSDPVGDGVRNAGV